MILMKRLLILIAGIISFASFPVFAFDSFTPPQAAGLSSSADTTVTGVYTFTGSSTTATLIKASTGVITNLVGTTAADNAATGNVGQYVSDFHTLVPASVSVTFFSISTITLTAGDWDLTCVADLEHGGATLTTGTPWQLAISANPNNTTTDHQLGDNLAYTVVTLATFDEQTASVSNWRRSISGTTSYYCKALVNIVSGVPTLQARLSARRMR